MGSGFNKHHCLGCAACLPMIAAEMRKFWDFFLMRETANFARMLALQHVLTWGRQYQFCFGYQSFWV